MHSLIPNGLEQTPGIIEVINRVAFAIRKEIVSSNGTACTQHRNVVCIEESADFGIIITGLEVIQLGIAGGSIAIRGKFSPWERSSQGEPFPFNVDTRTQQFAVVQYQRVSFGIKRSMQASGLSFVLS